MSFKAGDKVVCVDDAPRSETHLFQFPRGYVKSNTVYSIHEIRTVMLVNGPKPMLFIGLPAIWNDGEDYGWQLDRFRKVSEVGHPPIQILEPATA